MDALYVWIALQISEKAIEMIETFVGKFVVIEFKNRDKNERTIAYVVEVKDGFITLEAPAQKSRYAVNLQSVISITELPEDRVKPEFRK